MIPVPVITGLFSIGSKLIEKFFPDPAEKAKAELELLRMVRDGGMGCMLITAAAIDSMTSPHFPLVWHAPSSTWHGEDMGFCDLLDHNDIKLFCDLALSCEIGHLGLKEFRVNEVG